MKMTLLLSLCFLFANVSLARANQLNPHLAKVALGKIENTPGELKKQIDDAILLTKTQGISWMGAPRNPDILCHARGSKNYCYTTILFWHDHQDQLDTFVSTLRQSDSFQYEVSNKSGNFMGLIYSIDTKDGSLVDCVPKSHTQFPSWIDGYTTLNNTADSQSKLSVEDLAKIISSTSDCSSSKLLDIIKTVRIEAEITNSENCEFGPVGVRTCHIMKGLFRHTANY